MEIAKQLAKLVSYQVSFSQTLSKKIGSPFLKASSLKTLQINLGKKCNQACHHCHVDASPIRVESMDEKTADKCIDIIRNTSDIEIIDITGGAPEINPFFKKIVLASVGADKRVIDRCNLTILLEPGFEYLADFLAEHQVEIVASLPHYASNRTDAQRGRGVFNRSITALKMLNDLGYGRELPLNLVYNPSGLFLATNQGDLEKEFKHHLIKNFGVEFDNLYCINNMPINRFLSSLVKGGKFEQYMDVLVNAFNPSTVEGLMCRHQVSIDYLGNIYDCDFNQMLEMKADPISTIWQWEKQGLKNRSIKLNNHCFGCTAGAGSSCGGEIV